MKKILTLSFIAAFNLGLSFSVQAESEAHTCASGSTWCVACSACLVNDVTCPTDCTKCPSNPCTLIPLPKKQGSVYVLDSDTTFTCEGGSAPVPTSPTLEAAGKMTWKCPTHTPASREEPVRAPSAKH